MRSLNPTLTATGSSSVADGHYRHSGAGEGTLEQRSALQGFLAKVERRAFTIARLAVRNTDDALDIVQEAMLKLVRAYRSAPEEEWRLLFFRILHNSIRDHQRRSAVKNRIMHFFRSAGEDPAQDPIQMMPGPPGEQPVRQLTLARAMEALGNALHVLPARQQEAFSLRALEGFDVAETARIMGCSQGSVKSHYSRAVHSLRKVLGDHWP